MIVIDEYNFFGLNNLNKVVDFVEIIIVGIIVFLLIFQYLYQRNKRNESIIEFTYEVNKFNKKIKVLRKDYITYIQKDEIKDKYMELYNTLPRNIKNEDILKEFIETYSRLGELVKKWNEEFVEKELENNEELFDNIDGKSLDKQQRMAVVVDEMNNLVLAGAGSGKTLTISAKVKYLVDKKNIKPDEILLISFTRKAAEEMRKRIAEKLNIKIKSMTFHKLGLDIISQHLKVRPEVSDDLIKVINTYFEEKIFGNSKQIELLLSFFSYYFYIPKDLSEFNSLGESYEFYRGMDFETMRSKVRKRQEIKDEMDKQKEKKETLKGEIVKSYEELMIANFLFFNGIDYIYEDEYPYKSEDRYRKAYRPDFYLPDYDIYIEHFGITEDYRAPWLEGIEEERYIEGIHWKREEHRKNGTRLLETYSYYNKDNMLLTELEQILMREGVVFEEVNFNEIYAQILENKGKQHYSEFIKLLGTFIDLFKSNGYKDDKFDELKVENNLSSSEFLKRRANLFLEIVKPLYEEYEGYLDENGLIDFNDMINMARETLEDDLINLNYKYIIIDEYQDISMSRYKLIHTIREKTNAKVMCVGDDWQSIFRFAGSDVNLFTNFGKYFGYYELLKIENTYRNSQQLVNIAGRFIMKNPKQLQKNLKSNKRHSNPLRIFTYANNPNTAFKKAIEEIVFNFGEETKITVLGRNKFDINEIVNDKNNMQSEFKIITKGYQKNIIYEKYSKLKMEYLTVHRSKGIEGDNVIIINLENDLYGFPNRLSDDPILSPLLTESDDFQYDEERRLFYVALTRTKNSVYLMAPVYNQSVFCDELVMDFNMKYEPSDQDSIIARKANCPRCQKGFLVVRKNTRNGNEFLGCNNYPLCDYSLNDIDVINNQIKCTSCGGYMVKRKGPYSEFYGCTNYPLCTNTLNIERAPKDKDYSICNEGNRR